MFDFLHDQKTCIYMCQIYIHLDGIKREKKCFHYFYFTLFLGKCHYKKIWLNNNGASKPANRQSEQQTN